MNFFEEEFQFSEQLPTKSRRKSTFGPWVEPEQQQIVEKPFRNNANNFEKRLAKFLSTTKSTKEQKPKKPIYILNHKMQIFNLKKNLDNEIFQKKHSWTKKQKQMTFEQRIFQKCRKKENQALNTTIYFPHFNDKKHSKCDEPKQSIKTEEPKKTNEGFMKMLKIKEKIRVRNNSFVQKIKQKSQPSKINNLETNQLEMNGKNKLQSRNQRTFSKSPIKSKKSDKAIFYQTLSILENHKHGMKKPLFF